MSAGQMVIVAVFVIPLTVYVVVRLAAAAFFKSKQTYDQQKRNPR